MAMEQKIDTVKIHEESGLNINSKIMLFEKLQTLILPSEIDDYKTVCEIFEKFLEKGEYKYTDEICDLSETHEFLWDWIEKSNHSPTKVLNLVKHVFQIIIDKKERENGDELFAENKDLRCWLVLATLFSLSQISELIIEGTWEEVLYELLKYTRTWDMDTEFKVCSLSYSSAIIRNDNWFKDYFCWEWLVDSASSPITCPSPYLRLEFFRLILLFDSDKKVFSFFGERIVSAYVECMSSISPEKLFNFLGNNLFSIRHLMHCICSLTIPLRRRLKHVICGKVVKDLHVNQMGMEVGFVVNSLKVIGLFAQIANTRYKAKSNFLRCCLNICMYMFMFGHENNFSENIYNHKLLLPYTCNALADITDGILTLSDTLNDNNYGPMDQSELDSMKKERMLLYNKIVKRRNDLVNSLEISQEKLLHVKLCQKKAALALTKLELGTNFSDEIEPMPL
ncbi:unnamed protein product [Meganyctiphanes norvegica]|uniref:Uncharacterized protein n=1 Tax=Meganyctiphanes norvegica TaxID=48144 RepID=A0AAV2R6H4_MEGNR